MLEATRPFEVLLKKRDGRELSHAEIELFVRAVVRSGENEKTAGELPPSECVSEAQIASFLMAVYQRGLSGRELADLTEAMRFSGDVFDARPLQTFTVDKHSTGGVGDKTSLLIAPMVAAAGMRDAGFEKMQIPSGNDSQKGRGEVTRGYGAIDGTLGMSNGTIDGAIDGAPKFRVSVPMMSGRSLGHTGGTLDKLETIPGFDTQLSLARMAEVLRTCGAAMVGQTRRLVPADRILYALRDHTGTVESPFLIAASIMSKKLAEDLQALVLDVKVGSGAFMPNYEASRHLAELMVSTGERAGTRTVALLTRMDEPLGRFAGNWVEVRECVDILRGVRHPMSADLIELSCVLAGWMLHLAGAAATPGDGARLADAVLRDGRAYAAWLRLVAAQGGDVSVFGDVSAFHKPKNFRVLRAPVSGYLADMDCKQVGWAVQRLGAGRSRPGEPVSPGAGIEVHAKIGDPMEAGQPVFTLGGDSPGRLEEPLRMLEATLRFSEEVPPRWPIVREVVQTKG